MGVLSVLILGLVACGLTLHEVDGRCQLELQYPRPQVITHFGSKHLLAESTNMLLTHETHETVELHCANGFNLNTYGDIVKGSSSIIKLKCLSDNNYELDESGGNLVGYIGCLGDNVSNIYESLTPMPGCDGYMSLVVGQNFGKWGRRKTVAICYDIVNREVKHVSYTAYPAKLKFIEQTQVGQLNDLGLDIKVAYTKSIFKSISEAAIREAIRADKQLQALFTNDTFEYTSLIQDTAFNQDLLDLHEMLDIVWLRALRNGNWRHFLNALNVASLKGKFDVRVGYSGHINVPQVQTCNENRTLTFELDSGDMVTVPAHIWAHVRPLEPTLIERDEFVVIAHNSPFLTSNYREAYCKSICNEIPWLRNSLFGKLQQFPIYGLVQCCRIADVQNKLDSLVKIDEPTPSPAMEGPKYVDN